MLPLLFLVLHFSHKSYLAKPTYDLKGSTYGHPIKLQSKLTMFNVFFLLLIEETAICLFFSFSQFRRSRGDTLVNFKGFKDTKILNRSKLVATDAGKSLSVKVRGQKKMTVMSERLNVSDNRHSSDRKMEI